MISRPVPVQDTAQLQARVQAPQTVSYARMAELTRQVTSAVSQDEAVENVSAFVGVDGTNNSTLNSAQLLINLKDSHGSQSKVMKRLRDEVAKVPGVQLYMQPTQDLTVDAEEKVGSTQYRVSLEGANTQLVNDWAAKARERAGGAEEVERHHRRRRQGLVCRWSTSLT